jgi:hypothetical protein
MSAVSNQVRDAGAILPAVDAIANGRALAIELAAMGAGVAIFGAFIATGISGSFGLIAVGYLLFLLCAGAGFNGAGVVLMDESVGAPRRGFVDALLAGLFAFGKGIVVFLVAGLGLLVALLVVALLLWICKIPGVGPVLYFIVFPLCAVLLGILFVSFAFILAPIAGSAIWSGESIGAALARVVMVVRKRLLGVLVRGCVLFVLLMVAGSVLWMIAFSGTLATASMSLAIVGVNFDLSSLSNMFGGYGGYGGFGGPRYGYRGGGGGGGGYGVAMMIGLALIFVTVGTLLSLVLKKGWCLIYLQVARDLDVSKVEAEMQVRLAQVRAQAQAARERVQQQNLTSRQVAGGQAPQDPNAPGGGMF